MSNWINTKNYLPDLYIPVLVYIPSNQFNKILIDHTIKAKNIVYFINNVDFVTHWMYLPNTPKHKIN